MNLRSVLENPSIYRLFSRIIGSDYLFRTYVERHLRVKPGEKVLDLGCGPGTVLDYLPEVDYYGLDYSPEYIEKAKRTYSKRGKFFLCQIGKDTPEVEKGSFDLVMGNGVLHHLNDAEAVEFLKIAMGALKPGGRLVTLDGCLHQPQSRVATWLLKRDRGEYVRKQDQYLELAKKIFPEVESEVTSELLNIPYTHLIMRMKKPLGN